MELLSPPQLAAELGLPAQTLAAWRARGLGPTYLKVGRHVRYRRPDVTAWLDLQKHEPAVAG